MSRDVEECAPQNLRPCTEKDCTGTQKLIPMASCQTLQPVGNWWRCNCCLFEEKDAAIPSGVPVWCKPEPDKEFWDGEKFLVAIWVRVTRGKTWREGYEYYIIRASCDSETPVSFVHDESDQAFDEWDWEDVDWYIPINHKEVAGQYE